MPFSDVNLRTGEASMPAWGHISSLSEIASVSLEFTYLARWAVCVCVCMCFEREGGGGGGGGRERRRRALCGVVLHCVVWCGVVEERKWELGCWWGEKLRCAERCFPAACALLPAPPRPACRITGHAAFERAPLAVHEQLKGHVAVGGGLLGQYFNPMTGKATHKHGATITLGGQLLAVVYVCMHACVCVCVCVC